MGEGLKSPSFLYPNFVKNFTSKLTYYLLKNSHSQIPAILVSHN